jgi:hypothetical protein
LVCAQTSDVLRAVKATAHSRWKCAPRSSVYCVLHCRRPC